MKNAVRPFGLFAISLLGIFLNVGTQAQAAPLANQPVFVGPMDVAEDVESAAKSIIEPIGEPVPASWLTYKADLQRTGATNARIGAIPNLLWRHSTNMTAKICDTSPLVIGPPGQRRLYFAADELLFCLDGQTGSRIWESKPLSRPIA